MRRSLVMKTRIQAAMTRKQQAEAQRDAAMSAIAATPTEDKPHEDLRVALADVAACEAEIEALTAVQAEAERLDAADERRAKIDAMRAARARAIEQSAARVDQAKALEKAVKALADALAGLSKVNEALAITVVEATQNAAPVRGNPHDMMYFQQQTANVMSTTTEVLQQQFALALYDAGLGRVALDLGHFLKLENFGHLQHGKRESLVAAVHTSTDQLAYQIDDLHKRTGVVEVEDDEPEDVMSPITPPQVSKVLTKDPRTGEVSEEEYSIDTAGGEWGAK